MKARRALRCHLSRLSLGLLYALALPALADDITTPFKGADMTLYFNGGEVEQVISSQAVILVYLPSADADPKRYHPAHNDIAPIAQRLSANVAVVPLTQVWPVLDPRSRRWVRLARCSLPSYRSLHQDSPALFVSYAAPGGRHCAAFASTPEDITRLIALFLLLEETKCSLHAEFQSAVLAWARTTREEQLDGAAPLPAEALTSLLTTTRADVCS